MTQYFLAQNLTVTIQAALSVTGFASGVATVASTTGWTTGDIVLASGIGGITGATGKFSVTVSSSTTLTLKNLSNGATITTSGSYTSGGTLTHVGHLTGALTMDNTVFASANPDFTLKTDVNVLSDSTCVRVAVADTGDAFVSDIKPGPSVFAEGAQQNPSSGYETPSYKRADCPGLRLGNANNALRAEIYLEGLDGAAPSAAQTVTLTQWVEA